MECSNRPKNYPVIQEKDKIKHTNYRDISDTEMS